MRPETLSPPHPVPWAARHKTVLTFWTCAIAAETPGLYLETDTIQVPLNRGVRPRYTRRFAFTLIETSGGDCDYRLAYLSPDAPAKHRSRAGQAVRLHGARQKHSHERRGVRSRRSERYGDACSSVHVPAGPR